MRVTKLQKRYKKHPAVWGICIKPNKYIKTDRYGNPHKTLDGKMIIIDIKRGITREATWKEMKLYDEKY